MAVEGVMVSYNHSGPEENANIITVSSSGIKFADRWVLTHGSILSPLNVVEDIQNTKGRPILNDQFYENLPEMYITCERGANEQHLGSYYTDLELMSKRRGKVDLDHSSYQVRVVTGRVCHVWQCPALDRCVDEILYSWTIGHRDGDLEKQTQMGKALLSMFVLIDMEGTNRDNKPLRPLSELFDMVKSVPSRGAPLEVHSTPFGCEVFLNCSTRGRVCGVVGRHPSLVLSDVSTALGSEGAPVYCIKQDSRDLVGMVICSVSWWRGEWVGLTLIAPLVTVLAAKLRVAPAKTLLSQEDGLLQNVLNKIDKTTVLVRCGGSWGAGVYLGSGYVLTCAHVVKNHGIQKLSLYCQGVKETAILRYKSADDKAYDLAVLYSNAEHWTHLLPAKFAKVTPVKGEPVVAAGYPYFNETNLDDLRPTVTSGHVNNVSPSMIQTSCCVQSGFSGGPIFRLREEGSSIGVEVAGVIVCNAKTQQQNACYPYINMAVPSQIFEPLITKYLVDKDQRRLGEIESKQDIIQSQWRLQPYRCKM